MGGELVSPKAPDAVYSDQRLHERNKTRRQVGHAGRLRFSFPASTRLDLIKRRQVTLTSRSRHMKLLFKQVHRWHLSCLIIWENTCANTVKRQRSKYRFKCENRFKEPLQVLSSRHLIRGTLHRGRTDRRRKLQRKTFPCLHTCDSRG